VSRPLILRAVLLAVLVTYMQVGSFTRIVLREKDPWWAKSWRMYHGKAHDQCALTVYRLGDDGEREEIEAWWEILDTPRADAPRIDEASDVERVGRRLCRALPDTRLSLVRRCGRVGGFRKPTDTADDDVCNLADRLKRRLERQKRRR